MTQQEFFEAQNKARKEYLVLQRRTAREIHKIYVSAADEISQTIKELTIKGRGNSLTAEFYRKLRSSLTKAADDIIAGVDPVITNSIFDQSVISGYNHEKFLKDGLSISGLSTDKVSGDIMTNMYAGINTRLVELTYNRIIDGYNFYDRLGFLRSNWAAGVDSVITSGIAQNRDIIKIAEDLQKYARSGRAGLVKRYGKIARGTKKFIKRIPKNLDYRGQRMNAYVLILRLTARMNIIIYLITRIVIAFVLSRTVL